MTFDSQEQETNNTPNQNLGEDNSSNEQNTNQEPDALIPETETPLAEEANSNTEPHVIPNPLQDFKDAGLSADLQDILVNSKWKTPRPLDGIVLPHSLVGEDLVIQAASKTSAIVFLTLSHRLAQYKGSSETAPQALVIFQDGDSANKGAQDFLRLFGATGLTAKALNDVFDPEAKEQNQDADTAQANIIFASASSLKTAHSKNEISFDNVEVLVCRNVDTICEGGSSEDLEYVFYRSKKAQKLLFAGSISNAVRELSGQYLNAPKEISMERERATIPSVSHHAYLCETPNKFKTLMGLLRDHNPNNAIVFANNKLSAAWLYHKLLENGFTVEQLSSENANSSAKILVATDFDSRHFSSSEITHVYNFDLPEGGDAYLSRMSQVGKSGQGFVHSFVCDEYGQNYQYVQELLGQKAPKPVWAKEEYLQIVDKAGNPFLEKNIGYVEKRPGRDFDRPRRGHDGDRDRSFPRKDRHERSDRGDRHERSERPDRGERSERPERIPSRGPRIEERTDRPERAERGERDFSRGERSERFDRHERSDRNRHDRDREEGRSNQAPKIGPPQIKPRTRRAVHNPNQVKPLEQRTRLTPRETKQPGLLNKIFSYIFKKKN